MNNTRRTALIVALMLAACRAGRADLRPDELVLIVNQNEPAGRQLAEYYAAQRGVPADRICALDLPTADDMTAKQYAEQVVLPVRQFLHDRGLELKVRCLVTFYGVPLRIAVRVQTPADAAEVQANVAELTAVAPKVRAAIEVVERSAVRHDPTFKPANGQSLDDLNRRWVTAVRATSAAVAKLPNAAARRAATRAYLVDAAPLMGAQAAISVRQLDLQQHPDQQPLLAAAVAGYGQAREQATAAEGRPEDPDARAKLRVLVHDQLGLLQYVQLLRDQCDYLDARHGGQGFDSELALVQWRVHSHNFIGGNPYLAGAPGGIGKQHLFANPMFYPVAFGPAAEHPLAPTYMTCRLDGPTPQIVRGMIAASLAAERDGLAGKVVIDSLGFSPGHEPGHVGFGIYDQTLRDLRAEVAGRPGVDLVFDDKEPLLPAHSQADVAVYVGWYSCWVYVPTCSFARGAVAMHIASFAGRALRMNDRANWCACLLNDGAAATIGPVDEPYLFAFPRPDDFFPLLMTGRLTLAECYWRTEVTAGWQMMLVGDPLYRPYKARPPLQVADLPPRLRVIFDPPPTGAPAVGQGH